MATDNPIHAEKKAMTAAEVTAYVKKELDEDAERSQLQASNAGVLPTESATGVTLDLSHKYIHALPVEVIGLIKDKVERLALSHNPQISVPSQIVQCDRLRYLNIRWNQLTVFPESVLQLSKLEILDLSKNRITSVPEGIKRMSSLKFLAVSRNKIARLPLALGDMPSLSKLKFDDNPIVFPPLDEVLKPVSAHPPFSVEVGEEKDVCQKVKKFLKQQSLRQRMLGSTANADDETNESSVETPRPPKRVLTGGRFPIRPSISGAESFADLKSSPSSEHLPPPVPQRSHARVASTNAPTILKRPGIAPLLTGGNDISRSRSETASSSASLRQRRQGFVPTRKPTNELNRVSELSRPEDNRSSSASTIKPDHSRQSSSISTRSGFLAASSGGSSSGAVSPIDGPVSRFINGSRLSSLPENRDSRVQPKDTVKAAKRLRFTLKQLYEPVTHVASAIKEATPRKSTLERRLFTANAQLDEITRLLDRLDGGLDDSSRQAAATMKAIAKACVISLKSFGEVAIELRRSVSRISAVADGIYTRGLMFQVHSSMVEAKNICSTLGFQVSAAPARREPARASTAWSSKTVTPTQPRPNTTSRQRGATILQSMASDTTLRAMPPPPALNSMPSSANVSRSNTMTSMSSMTSSAAPTPRSAESFATLASARLDFSRSNTMRSVMDDGEGDGQFDRIFLKLKQACEMAGQALPNCRNEFAKRMQAAQTDGQSRLTALWKGVLAKCDIAIANNRALWKRLDIVKVNEPGVRYSREFWQHCDGFVHSWADLASDVKELGSQHIDISTVKIHMRQVQRVVRDVSKTISSSPLYHQAMGARQQQEPSLATPFTPGPSGHYSHESIHTPMPATPLSAALGPAAQATVASMPSGYGQQRDYFYDQHTSRRRAPQQ